MPTENQPAAAYPLDHVALVVPALEPVVARLVALGLRPGPVEEFPGEGTREVYLGGPEQAARLLLMQPLGDAGPYARALARRGPGLHHVALRVPAPVAFAAGAGGWLVHPACLTAPEEGRTLWLARPGVGCLLEVHEGPPGPDARAVVSRVEVPAPAGSAGLLALQVAGRPVAGLGHSPDEGAWLTLGGRRYPAASLARGA